MSGVVASDERSDVDGVPAWERRVLDALGVGLVVFGPGGAIAYVNGVGERFLGAPLAELRGRTGGELAVQMVDEDGRPLDVLERPGGRVRRTRRRLDGVVVGIDRPGRERVWARVRVWTLDVPEFGAEPAVVAQLEEVTESRRAEAQRQLQARLLDAVGQAVIATDLDGTIVYWNPAAERMTGWPADDVLGRPVTEVTPAPAESERADQIMTRLAGGESWTGEFLLRRRDGATYPAVVTNTPWHDELGRLAGVIGVSVDISDRLAVEQEAVRRAEAQTAVARLGQDALRTDDVDRFLADVLVTVADLVGAARVSLLEAREGGGYVRLRASTDPAGGGVGESFPLEPGTVLEETIRHDTTVLVDDQRGAPAGEAQAIVGPGLRSCASVALSTRGVVVGCLLAEREEPWDFSETAVTVLQSVANVVAATLDRERADHELQHLALHDQLTGLPNRTLFTDRLELALARRDRQEGDVALLFADLDRFKQVNDSLGHAAGDRLLVAVATRMQSAVRASDTVARLSGDEFAVLCEDLAGPEDAVALAERLALAFAQPFDVDGSEIVVSTSIGIAVAGDGDTGDSLLRHADTAMYEAKESGRNRYEVFDEALASNAFTRVATAAGLRNATAAGRLALRLQPIHTLADDRVEAVEALLRWDAPDRGIVTPGEFLDVAEDTGAIVEMGRWALTEACRLASGWPAPAGQRPPAVAVNLSPRELVHPDLAVTVAAALSSSGLDPRRLWLEVTEGAVMRHPQEGLRALAALASLGVVVVLDEFGTGASSLATLRDAPLHAVKIARVLVAGEGHGLADRRFVGAAIGLAHALGLRAVAVGVETAGQAEDVRALGADLGQGHHWRAPLSAAELDALLSR